VPRKNLLAKLSSAEFRFVAEEKEKFWSESLLFWCLNRGEQLARSAGVEPEGPSFSPHLFEPRFFFIFQKKILCVCVWDPPLGYMNQMEAVGPRESARAGNYQSTPVDGHKLRPLLPSPSYLPILLFHFCPSFYPFLFSSFSSLNLGDFFCSEYVPVLRSLCVWESARR
jgi:hypothetical protein